MFSASRESPSFEEQMTQLAISASRTTICGRIGSHCDTFGGRSGATSKKQQQPESAAPHQDYVVTAGRARTRGGVRVENAVLRADTRDPSIRRADGYADGHGRVGDLYEAEQRPPSVADAPLPVFAAAATRQSLKLGGRQPPPIVFDAATFTASTHKAETLRQIQSERQKNTWHRRYATHDATLWVSRTVGGMSQEPIPGIASGSDNSGIEFSQSLAAGHPSSNWTH